MSSRNTKGTGKVASKGAVKASTKSGQRASQRRQSGVTQPSQPSKGKPAKPGATVASAKTAETTTKSKEPSREDRAAVTIQRYVRRLLAKQQRLRREREKKDYEELMERLEKEAFVALVRREQEEMERERMKEEEEKKRRKEEQHLRARLLEAAFDGEAEQILAVLKEVSEQDTQRGVGFDEAGKRQRLLNQLRMINSTDANGNTAVSEASGGGHPEVITMLVERGADVNTQGAFGRTPLYRAAFGGHLEAVQTLLQLGADPRTHAEDGNTPEHVASAEAIVQTLQGWDVSITDSMLKKMRAELERRAEQDRKQKEAETDRLKGEVEHLQREQERGQRELQKAYVELNKRITEHDQCERTGMEQATVTLQVVHDAEDALEKARLAAQQATEQLALAKLTLREQSGDAVLEHGGVRCLVRDLDDVLIKDVGGKIQQDGRWPLLVDPSGQAATFLRYRDTNYLNALSPEDMKPDALRVALLGAIRYGKPLVVNMMELDLLESVERQLEQVSPGLRGQLMSKELLQDERYLSLLRCTDGPQYSRTEFRLDRIEKFSLVMVTKQRHPPDAMLTDFYPIKVMLPDPKI